MNTGLIADIFVTTKGRQDLLVRSLRSLGETTDPRTYRLTLIDDGGETESEATGDALWNARSFLPKIEHRLIHRENLGLGPSINQALSHIDTLNGYFNRADQFGDPAQVAPFICYCQDDLLYSDGWLAKLAKFFLLFEKQHNLGFASGVECVEHKTKKDLGNGMLLKDWIRAAQMFGRREYWMSMFPIPRFDVETGRVRAKPDNGMGSGVDWHFIRNHKNSVCNSGRTCLVLPGLAKHLGYKESTWLKRELPESDSDKRAISEAK